MLGTERKCPPANASYAHLTNDLSFNKNTVKRFRTFFYSCFVLEKHPTLRNSNRRRNPSISPAVFNEVSFRSMGKQIEETTDADGPKPCVFRERERGITFALVRHEGRKRSPLQTPPAILLSPAHYFHPPRGRRQNIHLPWAGSSCCLNPRT